MKRTPLFLHRAIFVVATAASSCLAATTLPAAAPEAPPSQAREKEPPRTKYYQRVEIEDVKSLEGFLRRSQKDPQYEVKLVLSADGKLFNIAGKAVTVSSGYFDVVRFERQDRSTAERLQAIYEATEELKSTPGKRGTGVATLVRVIAEIERFAEEIAEPPTAEQEKQQKAVILAARSVASDPDRIQTLDQAIGDIKELAYDMWEFRGVHDYYKIPAKAI